MALDATLRHDIIEFLTPLPLFENERTRRAMLLDAGFETITRTFDLSGNPAQSVSLLIEHIYQCGGMPALAQFVEKVGAKLGKDQREKADGFCERLRRAAAPTAAAPVAPDMLRFQEPVLNLEKECAAFRRILSGDDAQTRLILIHGKAGMSKSHFIGLCRQMTLDDRRRKPCHLDFDAYHPTVEQFLGDLIEHLGGIANFPEYLNGESKAGSLIGEPKWRVLTSHFFLDLARNQAIPPLMLLLDTFEEAESSFKIWLTQEFLSRLANQTPLTVVLAGKKPVAPPPPLNGRCQQFHLSGVSLEECRRYAKVCRREVEEQILMRVWRAMQDAQGQVVAIVNIVKTSPLAQEAHHE